MLNDIAGLDTPDGKHIGMEFMARFDPAVCRPLFDPASLMAACDRALERQNQAEERACAIHEIDAVPMPQFESRLAPDFMDQAFELLTGFVREHREVALSALLEAACHEQYPPLMPRIRIQTAFTPRSLPWPNVSGRCPRTTPTSARPEGQAAIPGGNSLNR